MCKGSWPRSGLRDCPVCRGKSVYPVRLQSPTACRRSPLYTKGPFKGGAGLRLSPPPASRDRLRGRTPLSLRDISPHCGESPSQRGPLEVRPTLWGMPFESLPLRGRWLRVSADGGRDFINRTSLFLVQTRNNKSPRAFRIVSRDLFTRRPAGGKERVAVEVYRVGLGGLAVPQRAGQDDHAGIVHLVGAGA